MTRGADRVVAEVETDVWVMVSIDTLTLLLAGEVGLTEVELPWVTGDPSVEEAAEYEPTRESLLKLMEKEGPLEGP